MPFSFSFIFSDNMKFAALTIKNKSNKICRMININDDNNKTFLVWKLIIKPPKYFTVFSARLMSGAEV